MTGTAVQTTTVRDPRFGPETDALLDALGPPQPLDYPTVVAARTEEPDPAYAGVADPRVHVAELCLPLRWGPCLARVYTPPRGGPGPLLLWLHGGGFVAGSGRDLDAPCTGIALRGGVVVVSLEYRLAPEHPFPAALEDACDALCWLSENAATLGGDGRVAVGGQSAGGNIAAALCLMARDRGGPAVAAQVLCYPLLDFGRDTESGREFDGVFHSVRPGLWLDHAFLAGQTPTPYAAPLRADTLAALPPALLVGAGRDPLRDDARDYAARLAADGVAVQSVEYDATMHAFLNFSAVLSAAGHAVGVIATFLREHCDAGVEHGYLSWRSGASHGS